MHGAVKLLFAVIQYPSYNEFMIARKTTFVVLILIVLLVGKPFFAIAHSYPSTSSISSTSIDTNGVEADPTAAMHAAGMTAHPCHEQAYASDTQSALCNGSNCSDCKHCSPPFFQFTSTAVKTTHLPQSPPSLSPQHCLDTSIAMRLRPPI